MTMIFTRQIGERKAAAKGRTIFPKKYKTAIDGAKKPPKRRKRKNSAVRMPNPLHMTNKPTYRGTGRGRPAKSSWWMLDVYTGTEVKTYIGNGDKTSAERDALATMIKQKAARVALSGPYSRQPNLDSKRK